MASNVINISDPLTIAGPGGSAEIQPGTYSLLYTMSGTFHLYQISMVDSNPVEIANPAIWADLTESYLSSLDPDGDIITQVEATFVPLNIMTFTEVVGLELSSGDTQNFDVGSYLIMPRNIMDPEGNLLEGESLGLGTFMAVKVEIDEEGNFLPPTAEALSDAILLDSGDISGASLAAQIEESEYASLEEDGLLLDPDSIEDSHDHYQVNGQYVGTAPDAATGLKFNVTKNGTLMTSEEVSAATDFTLVVNSLQSSVSSQIIGPVISDTNNDGIYQFSEVIAQDPDADYLAASVVSAEDETQSYANTNSIVDPEPPMFSVRTHTPYLEDDNTIDIFVNDNWTGTAPTDFDTNYQIGAVVHNVNSDGIPFEFQSITVTQGDQPFLGTINVNEVTFTEKSALHIGVYPSDSDINGFSPNLGGNNLSVSSLLADDEEPGDDGDGPGYGGSPGGSVLQSIKDDGTGGFDSLVHSVAVGSKESESFSFDTGDYQETVTATFINGKGVTEAETEGDPDIPIDIGFTFTSSGTTHSVGDDDDYAAFGGDGDDYATGMSFGDTFIGGAGKDSAVIQGKFNDYTFAVATKTAVDVGVVETQLGKIVTSENVPEAQEAGLLEYVTGGDAIYLGSSDDEEEEQVAPYTEGNSSEASNAIIAVFPPEVTEDNFVGIHWAVDGEDMDLLDGRAASSDFAEQTFMVTDAEVGTEISFKVTFTNADGDEVTLNSAAEEPVAGPPTVEPVIWTITNDTDGEGNITVQAENIFFAEDPGMTVTIDGNPDDDPDLPDAPLAEKNNAADLFKTHAAVIDLGEAYSPEGGDDQVLHWQIHANGGEGEASHADFITTHGTVTVGAGETSAVIDIQVKNDGDMDEANETFDIKVGYSVGDEDGVFLEQASVTSTIEGDPLEYYVFTGANYWFQGKDFLGQDFDKYLEAGDENTFSSISAAMTAAATAGGNVTEIRVAENHNEDGEITVTVDNLLIDFWGQREGSPVPEGGLLDDLEEELDAIPDPVLGAALTPEQIALLVEAEFIDSPDELPENAVWTQDMIDALPNEEELEEVILEELEEELEAIPDPELGALVSPQQISLLVDVGFLPSADSLSAGQVWTQEMLDLLPDQEEVMEELGVTPPPQMKVFKFALAEDVNDVSFGGSRDLIIMGNDLDNQIIGNNGNNEIYGMGGNDSLLGYGGNDLIYGGGGADFIDGMAGSDKVYGQRGSDTVVATGSNEFSISTATIDEAITAEQLAALVGAGEDVTGIVADTTNIDAELKQKLDMLYNIGDFNSSDVLSGGSGADTIIDAANKAGDGSVVMIGGSGADTFAFGTNKDSITYSEDAPVDAASFTERSVSTHIIDLSVADTIDLSTIENADGAALSAEAVTTMIEEGSEPGTMSVNLSGDNDMLGITVEDGDYTYTAPELELSGSIEISNTSEAKIVASLELAVSATQDEFNETGLDLYGTTENLIWAEDPPEPIVVAE